MVGGQGHSCTEPEGSAPGLFILGKPRIQEGKKPENTPFRKQLYYSPTAVCPVYHCTKYIGFIRPRG